MTLSQAGQKIIRAELRRRTPQRGMAKRVAYDLGVSYHHLCGMKAGRVSIAEHMAWRILELARREDLALADKIEAELARPLLRLKDEG